MTSFEASTLEQLYNSGKDFFIPSQGLVAVSNHPHRAREDEGSHFNRVETDALILGVTIFGNSPLVAQIVNPRHQDGFSDEVALLSHRCEQLSFDPRWRAARVALSERIYKEAIMTTYALMAMAQPTGRDNLEALRQLEQEAAHWNDGQMVSALLNHYGRNALLDRLDITAVKELLLAPEQQERHAPIEPEVPIPTALVKKPRSGLQYPKPPKAQRPAVLDLEDHHNLQQHKQAHAAAVSTVPLSPHDSSDSSSASLAMGGVSRKRNAEAVMLAAGADYDGANSGKVCINCGTRNTPLWRKDRDGCMCNACGIYFKSHGFHRPIDLERRAKRPSADHHCGASAGFNAHYNGRPYQEPEAPFTSSQKGHAVASPSTSMFSYLPSQQQQQLQHVQVMSESCSEGGNWNSAAVAAAAAADTGYQHLPHQIRGSPEPAGASISRRSDRARTTKNLGQDWFNPDEIVLRQGQQVAFKRRSTTGEPATSNPAAAQSSGRQYKESDGQFEQYKAWSQGGATDLAWGGCGAAGAHEHQDHFQDTVTMDLAHHVMAGMPTTPIYTPPPPPRYTPGPLGTLTMEGDGSLGCVIHDGSDEATTLPTSAAGGSDDDEVTQAAAVLLQLKHTVVIVPAAVRGPHWEGLVLQPASASDQVADPSNGWCGLWGEQGQDLAAWKEIAGTSGLPWESCATPNEEGGAFNHTVMERPIPATSRSRQGTGRAGSGGNSHHNSRLVPSRRVCDNCGVTRTPVWRKDRETGAAMCNACGIYKQTHGYNREF